MSEHEGRGASRGPVPPHLERRLREIMAELDGIAGEMEESERRDLRQPGAVAGPEPGDIPASPGALELGIPRAEPAWPMPLPPPYAADDEGRNPFADVELVPENAEPLLTANEHRLAGLMGELRRERALAAELHDAAETRAVEAELAAAAATRRALRAELELQCMTPRLARAERRVAELTEAMPAELDPPPEIEDTTPAPRYRAPLEGTVPAAELERLLPSGATPGIFYRRSCLACGKWHAADGVEPCPRCGAVWPASDPVEPSSSRYALELEPLPESDFERFRREQGERSQGGVEGA